MSHIRSENTRTEVRLRKELFALGYRFRINVKKLPGTPDIVLAKYRTCIFVNGCFWHGHKGCSRYVVPKTRTEFWVNKISNNRERDLRDYRDLDAKGWHVIVVWECELSKLTIDATVERIVEQLSENRADWLAQLADRRKRREEWQDELRRRKEHSALLLSSISIK